MINVVCAVLENADDDFLVCQRPVGKTLAGCWEFPGGKIEPGESEPAALRREISEELGCLVSVGEALPTVEYHYPEFSIRLIPFRCALEKGLPQRLEHAALRWIAAAELPTLQWAEADVPIWQHLLSVSS